MLEEDEEGCRAEERCVLAQQLGFAELCGLEGDGLGGWEARF